MQTKQMFSVIFKILLLFFVLTALFQEIFPSTGARPGALLYFTIQSNVLVALYLIYTLFFTRKNKSTFLVGLILLAITMTGLAYNFLIYHIFTDWHSAAYSFSRTATHVIVPIGFLINWLLFEEHGNMKWRYSIYWLIYPCLYGLGVALIGIKTGISLYFFWNPSQGLIVMSKWFLLMTLAFLIIGLLFIIIDHALKHKNFL